MYNDYHEAIVYGEITRGDVFLCNAKQSTSLSSVQAGPVYTPPVVVPPQDKPIVGRKAERQETIVVVGNANGLYTIHSIYILHLRYAVASAIDDIGYMS